VGSSSAPSPTSGRLASFAGLRFTPPAAFPRHISGLGRSLSLLFDRAPRRHRPADVWRLSPGLRSTPPAAFPRHISGLGRSLSLLFDRAPRRHRPADVWRLSPGLRSTPPAAFPRHISWLGRSLSLPFDRGSAPSPTSGRLAAFTGPSFH